MVEAAGDLFWERGYEMTSIGELEKKTGLDRSSLYHAFGNKHALFEAALKCYVEVNLEARLVGMREGEAGLETVADFFTGMAETFRSDPRAGRGCLMVNSVAELGSRDSHVVRAAVAYRDKFREAFAATLRRRHRPRRGRRGSDADARGDAHRHSDGAIPDGSDRPGRGSQDLRGGRGRGCIVAARTLSRRFRPALFVLRVKRPASARPEMKRSSKR